MAVTQHERILNMLRREGGFGVCGVTFLQQFMPTYSQRIGELKRRGYEIESKPCELHGHGGQIARYTLISEPPP